MAKKTNPVLTKTIGIATDVYKVILKKRQPSLEAPLRSLNNVRYDDKIGYFELNGKVKSRTLTAASVKSFAQTLLMMNESKKLVEQDDITAVL